MMDDDDYLSQYKAAQEMGLEWCMSTYCLTREEAISLFRFEDDAPVRDEEE